MTEQRRVIARVLAQADDHPDVEELYRRCGTVDERISISTVYRTVKLFEDSGIIERHDFREGRARYETSPKASRPSHQFAHRRGDRIPVGGDRALQAEVARKLGYRLIDHRLELYAVPLNDEEELNAADAPRIVHRGVFSSPRRRCSFPCSGCSAGCGLPGWASSPAIIIACWRGCCGCACASSALRCSTDRCCSCRTTCRGSTSSPSARSNPSPSSPRARCANGRWSASPPRCSAPSSSTARSEHQTGDAVSQMVDRLEVRHAGRAVRRRHVERRQPRAAVPLGAARRGGDGGQTWRRARPADPADGDQLHVQRRASRSAASAGLLAAWYGDLDFMPHIRTLIERAGVDAVVSFGEPVAADAALPARR